MSITIIPLAGADFYSDKYGIRPLFPVFGTTLIEYVLNKRTWLSDIIFVLREEKPYSDIMKDFIHQTYPNAKIVTISTLTAGAPLSSLAGFSLVDRYDVPIIIDLADIAFDLAADPLNYFEKNPQVDAIVPYFQSNDKKFSYLTLDGNKILQAKEKEVISANASAGVYFFRNASVYLKAMQYCIANPSICRVNQSVFVCPTINGLIYEGKEAHGIAVNKTQPISSLFHPDED